jgi:hypothetical protein
MSFGVWRSMEAVQRYLSALILPSDAAWLFFGWLRPRFSPTLGENSNPAQQYWNPAQTLFLVGIQRNFKKDRESSARNTDFVGIWRNF